MTEGGRRELRYIERERKKGVIRMACMLPCRVRRASAASSATVANNVATTATVAGLLAVPGGMARPKALDLAIYARWG